MHSAGFDLYWNDIVSSQCLINGLFVRATEKKTCLL